MSAAQRRLQELRSTVPQLNPHEAHERQRDGAVLIDIRDADELAQGVPAGSKRISRGFLELKIEQEVPDTATPVLVMCASGVRSLFAAESLLQLGYKRVSSVAGGFNAWKKQGLPVDNPRLVPACTGTV